MNKAHAGISGNEIRLNRSISSYISAIASHPRIENFNLNYSYHHTLLPRIGSKEFLQLQDYRAHAGVPSRAGAEPRVDSWMIIMWVISSLILLGEGGGTVLKIYNLVTYIQSVCPFPDSVSTSFGQQLSWLCAHELFSFL